MSRLGRIWKWAWRWLVRKTGPFGLFTLVILQITFVFVTEGLEDVIPGLADAGLRLFFVALGGILLGRFAGGRRNGWLWMLLGMVLGLPVVFLHMSSLWSELLLASRLGLLRLLEIGSAALQGAPSGQLPPAEPLQLAWSDFSARAWLNLIELRTWLSDLFQGRPSFRATAVQLAWGVLLYWLALWAGTVIRRTENALVALFPAGAVLGGLLAYARSEQVGMLVLFLMGVLVLYAGVTQKDNEQRWEAHRLDYPVDIRLDFSFSTSVLIGGILLVAYIVPQVNVRSAFRSLLGLDRPLPSSSEGGDGLAESLGIERPTKPPPFFSLYEDGGLPRSQLLGSGPDLAFEEVLHVRIIGPGLGEGARYYWRGLTYDSYSGRGWTTELTRAVRYGRGQQAPLPDQVYVQLLRQEVRVVGGAAEIAYAAGDIFAMDTVFEVAWRVPAAPAYDPFGVRIATDVYQADSRVPIRLDNLLRAAGTDYPEWVTERYLGVPESLPQRVRDLAFEVTRGEPNPYDRAIALERFLRGFTYNLSLPAPPRDRDLVDYFLFDLQQGYCDYYASSMVVMARSLGIPARLAVGFAQGEYDPAADQFVVMALDAHSWPELYFPGFGWVPFEPTAGIAAIDRSAFEAVPQEPFVPDLPPQTRTAPILERMVRVLGIVFGVGLIGLGGWVLLDRFRMQRLNAQDFYREIFDRMYAYRRSLALPVPLRSTPNELTAALTAVLDARFRDSQLLQKLPGDAGDLHSLAASYNRIQYASTRPDEARRKKDARLWRRLRFKIWLAAWLPGSGRRRDEAAE